MREALRKRKTAHEGAVFLVELRGGGEAISPPPPPTRDFVNTRRHFTTIPSWDDHETL